MERSVRVRVSGALEGHDQDAGFYSKGVGDPVEGFEERNDLI